jgi:digeranylgeranylglycerophospholipid reductase
LFDVLIVGGGPVGSQTAFQLAGMGYTTAVIEEKTDHAEPVCCTGIISEECFRAFEITPKVVFRHVNSASVYSPSGKRLRLARPASQAVVIDRPAFNAFMTERARKRGAEYRFGTRVAAVRVGRDMVSITTSVQGTQANLEARAVVVATGFGSFLTETIGLGRPRNLVGGSQAEVETRGVAEVEVYLGKGITPGFFAWLVPTSPNRALAGLLARHAPREQLKAFLGFLKDQDKITSIDVPLTSGAVPLRASPKTYADRLLVAGTAAGLVKPLTGGGIYFGLLSADMAAEVLHDAFARDDLSSHQMANYQRLWKRKLGHELKVGSWAHTLLQHQSDRRLDRIFDIMSAQGRLDALVGESDISFDWHSRAVRHLLSEGTLAKLIIGKKNRSPALPRRRADCPREEISD